MAGGSNEAVLAIARAHKAELARLDRSERRLSRKPWSTASSPRRPGRHRRRWTRPLGLTDQAMVKAEPFSQWVIEDRFAGERPDFEAARRPDHRRVAPWEEAKLRLLNGAHSAIAYLGGLAGIDFVHEFVAIARR